MGHFISKFRNFQHVWNIIVEYKLFNEVLLVVSVHIVTFWDLTQHSSVGRCQCFS
jgi:hypothetical protein